MIRSLFLFAACFWAGTQVWSQAPMAVLASLPDSVREGAHAVVVSDNFTYTIHSSRSVTQRQERTVLILDRKHKREQQLYTFYDEDSKVTDFELSATDLLGNTTRIRRADVADERYTSDGTFVEGTYVKHATVSCESYPCVVTTLIERKLKDFAAILQTPRWTPVDYAQGLKQATFTAQVPVDNDILYRAHDMEDAEVTTDGKVRTYTWRLGPRAPICDETLSPASTEVLPHLYLAIEDFRVDEYAGRYTDWQSFGQFIGQIMEGRDVLPERLAHEVHETVATATTRRDTINRLYRLMQERCRYVGIQLGIGGWQPFSAEYVEQNRYGDCKALSNFMGAMLKEVGITAYPVLLYSGDRPYYDVEPDFAFSSFNHMILYVPGEDIYLECTSKDEPTGYLSDSKEDRNVIWITPEGGKLARTPALLPSEHGHVRTVRQELDAEGLMAFRMTGAWFGADQETFRAVGSYLGSERDQRDWLHRNDYLPDVSGGEYRFDVLRDQPEVRMAYTSTLDNRTRKLGSRNFVQLNPYPRTWIPESIEDRKLPVVYSDPRMLVDTVHFAYPAGYEIETGLLREPVVYEHPVGEYRAEMRAGEHAVTWIRTLKLRSVRLAAEEYADFRQFFVDVAKAESIQLVLKERRTK